LRGCVPLEHAEFALARIEALLRERFADVVDTAASYVLSDDREVAIQMATVATTMAAREVRSGIAEIIGQTRLGDEQS
jgi:superfamily II DNA/RNA helicase